MILYLYLTMSFVLTICGFFFEHHFIIMLTALGTCLFSPPPHTFNSCTKPPSLAKVKEAPGCKAGRKPRGGGGRGGRWQGHSRPQLDYCLGQSTAGVQHVLEDGSILMGREGQWQRWAPGVRETWFDPNHLCSEWSSSHLAQLPGFLGSLSLSSFLS